jgi:hypothetical protein
MSSPSTGPRTDAGKEHSSMNAVKHGLRAETIVLPHESAEEWEALRQATHRQYRPCGMIETELVERIALSLWRLRRAAPYEVEAFQAEDRDKAIARVIRYEGHLSRQLNQALKLLREEQEERPLRGVAPLEPPRQKSEPRSSFGKNDVPRESSFGKTTPRTVEMSSFGDRAEEVIVQRLLEMVAEDRTRPAILPPATT